MFAQSCSTDELGGVGAREGRGRGGGGGWFGGRRVRGWKRWD